MSGNARLPVFRHDLRAAPVVAKEIDHRGACAKPGGCDYRCGDRPAALNCDSGGALDPVAGRESFNETENIERRYAQANDIQQLKRLITNGQAQ